MHIKALTAVEIAHLARIEKTREREVLLALQEAGLTSLPGGGAEVFSTAVRATIAERKLTGEEWIRVHRVAHELGIPTNCTMLYGHVETADDRIEHLVDAARRCRTRPAGSSPTSRSPTTPTTTSWARSWAGSARPRRATRT